LNIAWGITGAGAFLRESVETLLSLFARGHRITAFVSRAGEKVLEAYGLKKKLEEALRGPYPVGVVYESLEPPGYPTTGRLYLGVYSLVVVAPATLNTASKILHGIADALVPNLAIHAVKARIPVYILPVDLYEVKSYIPVVIDRSKCAQCTTCYAARACPTGALAEHAYYKVVVDASRCTRCYECLKACPHGAIEFDVEVVVKPVSYYAGLLRRLELIPCVKIIESPSKLVGIVEEAEAGSCNG
jgi:dihydromethanopterin reductase (acceptor)